MSKFESMQSAGLRFPPLTLSELLRSMRQSSRRNSVRGQGPSPAGCFPIGDGGVGGCLVQRPEQKPAADGTLVYLNVDGKLDQVLKRAQQNCGKLLVPRTAIDGGFGSYAVITDSEGNHIGLHSR